jgi:hypothetical protein
MGQPYNAGTPLSQRREEFLYPLPHRFQLLRVQPRDRYGAGVSQSSGKMPLPARPLWIRFASRIEQLALD